MRENWSKDEWIRRALAQRVYIAKEDGSIWKLKKIEKGLRVYKRVTLSTHAKTGRVYFTMTFEGITKSVLVNRIVAWAFHPNPDNKPQVNHLDGDKANNAKSNLEWSTRSENEQHAFQTGLKASRGSMNANAKLTAADVQEIRNAPPDKLADIAMMKQVSAKTIRDIRERKTWKHL